MIFIRTLSRFSLTLGLLSTSLLTAPAMAQESSTDTLSSPLSSPFASAVDSSTLDSYRGGSTQVRNDMVLTGTTADNTAQHVNTGNNAISEGAFSHMSGIPVVIQNSGANVLIQNAVIVNLQMN